LKDGRTRIDGVAGWTDEGYMVYRFPQGMKAGKTYTLEYFDFDGKIFNGKNNILDFTINVYTDDVKVEIQNVLAL
jgi:hypothetical protein